MSSTAQGALSDTDKERRRRTTTVQPDSENFEICRIRSLDNLSTGLGVRDNREMALYCVCVH